jgi:hypothetical protein
MAEDRPLCRCHGEPMLKNGLSTWRKEPTQEWRCATERRAKARRTYDELQHVAYSKRLLQMRRASATYKRRLRAA